MELSDYLRDPMSAALIAGGITAAYIHLKAHLNNEPAALNAILVFFIVSGGIGQKEAISTEPF